MLGAAEALPPLPPSEALPAVTPPPADDPGTIVVNGLRDRGKVLGDIPAEVTLNAQDIRAIGASSIAEILTKPIAPNYRNDGGSLRDVADKIDVVIERQSYISERLDKHIDWHLDKGE